MKTMIVLLLSFVLMASTCSKTNKGVEDLGVSEDSFVLEYSINKPDSVFLLKKALAEISGLTYSDKLNVLYAINDEKGIIYKLSPDNGEILEKIGFAKKDDYEGITYHEGVIYVVESNGNIKVVRENDSEKTGEFDDILSRDNDVEGLVYNPSSNSLLLAAKGDSEADRNNKKYKSLFNMDINSGAIDPNPFMKIDAVKSFEEIGQNGKSKDALVEMTRKSRVKQFSPSGIAIHPETHDLYILSARGKLLMICTLEGDVKSIIFLNQSLHVQPEGICFDNSGTLFISNEGKGRSGKVFKYKRK